jgi:hypothetical protein
MRDLRRDKGTYAEVSTAWNTHCKSWISIKIWVFGRVMGKQDPLLHKVSLKNVAIGVCTAIFDGQKDIKLCATSA